MRKTGAPTRSVMMLSQWVRALPATMPMTLPASPSRTASSTRRPTICLRVAPTTRQSAISRRRSTMAVKVVLATASDATSRATSPPPSITLRRKARARLSSASACLGETTERPGTFWRIRSATCSGSSPWFQKTAAAVAIGSTDVPGTIARRRSTGSLSSSRRSAVANGIMTKLSGPVSVGSSTPTT